MFNPHISKKLNSMRRIIRFYDGKYLFCISQVYINKSSNSAKRYKDEEKCKKIFIIRVYEAKNLYKNFDNLKDVKLFVSTTDNENVLNYVNMYFKQNKMRDEIFNFGFFDYLKFNSIKDKKQIKNVNDDKQTKNVNKNEDENEDENEDKNESETYGTILLNKLRDWLINIITNFDNAYKNEIIKVNYYKKKKYMRFYTMITLFDNYFDNSDTQKITFFIKSSSKQTNIQNIGSNIIKYFNKSIEKSSNQKQSIFVPTLDFDDYYCGIERRTYSKVVNTTNALGNMFKRVTQRNNSSNTDNFSKFGGKNTNKSLKKIEKVKKNIKNVTKKVRKNK